MHRRDAAQPDIAHVQRLEPCGAQRGGAIVDRGDRARPVADVQDAGLHRDVGGGEMMVQETAQVGRMVLRHDAPGALVEEAVDHHPVIPRDRPERGCRALAQRLQVARAFERRRHVVQHRDHRSGGHRLGGDGFQFYRDQIADPVRGYRKAFARPVHIVPDRFVRRRIDRLSDQRRQRPTEPVGR